MRIGSMTAWGGLLAATLISGCAVRPGDVNPAHPELGPVIGVIKSTAMGDDEVRALQTLPVAEQRRRLDAVLVSYPDDLFARFSRTQAEYAMADVTAVDVDSQRILADPALEGTLRQWVLQWRAEALIQLRRFDESVVAANQALEIDASSAEALSERGWARFFLEQGSGALDDLNRALQLDPSVGVMYYRRAQVLAAQGKPDRAARDFERAIELAPDDGPTHREYGVLLYKNHDVERALAQFDVGVRLMPGDPFVIAWRAQANFALKRFDAAAADDHSLSELGVAKDDLFEALKDVGVDLADQQDFDGAAREFGRSLALKFDPANATDLARMQWFAAQFGPGLESFRQYGAAPISGDLQALWLFTARGRANPADETAAKVELASLVRPHQPHVWTDTLVSLLLGQTTLEAALAEADASDTDKLKAGRRCEADYYAAEQFLMHEKVALASRLLDEAYRVCPWTYIEANAVIGQRRLLAAKLPAH